MVDSVQSSNVATKHRLRLWTQPFLDETRNTTSMLLIRFLEVFSNPDLEISTRLRPGIFSLRADGRQGGEADAERHVFDVVFGNEVVLGCWEWRELEELEEGLAGERPPLLVACSEGFGVRERFGEGDDCGLAVKGAGEFLGLGEDDVEIDWGEKSVQFVSLEFSR